MREHARTCIDRDCIVIRPRRVPGTSKDVQSFDDIDTDARIGSEGTAIGAPDGFVSRAVGSPQDRATRASDTLRH